MAEGSSSKAGMGLVEAACLCSCKMGLARTWIFERVDPLGGGWQMLYDVLDLDMRFLDCPLALMNEPSLESPSLDASSLAFDMCSSPSMIERKLFVGLRATGLRLSSRPWYDAG